MSAFDSPTAVVDPAATTAAPAPGDVPARDVARLAIVIPTFKESANIRPLLDLLDAALQGVAWEAIFVDDASPDGTARVVREAAARDPRVRCLHRIGRRGLASAVIEGALSTSAPFVAVMDADLQHDETLLPRMLEKLHAGEADVVIASRYVDGGGVGDWNAQRAFMSRFATRLAHLILRQQVSDPMSGFFMTRRECFEDAVPHLSGEGYKILLDYLASSKQPLRVAEVPYVFRQRLHGESKLDSLVLWEYAMLLLDKTVGRWVPPRFILFGAVGGLGLVVHMAVLAMLMSMGGLLFSGAQLAATGVAMCFNFAINNLLTYRDRRLRGWKWFRGLASFCLVCSLGATANVGAASFLFEQRYDWWLSGLAGVVVGTFFNFLMTSVFTWRR